jgi:hypothetical protein
MPPTTETQARERRRASIIFYVLSLLPAFGFAASIMRLVEVGLTMRVWLSMSLYVIIGALMVMTARGIETAQPWARVTGYVVALLLLINFPLGTAAGLAIAMYIQRANRVGMFDPVAPPAPPPAG